MKERLRLRCSFLRVCAFALLARTKHKSSYIQCRPKSGFPLARDPPLSGPRRLPARPRDRRPGSSRYNCVLCSIRRLHCHPDSSGVPAGRAIPHCAAIGSPTGRHPARQLRRSAVLEVWSGRLSPEAPAHPPDARPPFHPQGGTAPERDWFDGWPHVATFRQAFRVGL